MKRLLLLIPLLLAGVAQAQQYTVTTLSAPSNISTNGADTAVSSNCTAVVTLTRYDSVAVQCTFAGFHNNTTSGDRLVLTFSLSSDGTTYATGNTFTFPLQLNGTTSVSITTNLPPSLLTSVGYLKLTSIAGTTNTPATNIVIKVAIKSSRTG